MTAVYERVMPIVELTLRDEDGTEFTLRSSGEHPFWTERDGWASVSELEVGDVLRGPDDAPVELVGIVATDEVEVTYNLTVEGNHTFYVYDADGEGLWGHNTDESCPVAGTSIVRYDERFANALEGHATRARLGDIPDDEIIVVGSRPFDPRRTRRVTTPGVFILRPGIDTRPVAGLLVPGKSGSIATTLRLQDEYAQMFGAQRAARLRRGDSISAAQARDIRHAGFDVLRAPTFNNPLHVRIVASSRRFDEEGREWLSLAFDLVRKK